MQQVDQSEAAVCAIVVAGGSGLRAGGGAAALPKQYAPVGGEPMLRHSLRAFLGHDRVTHALAVIRPGDEPLFEDAVYGLPGTLLAPVHGGATRQLSVIAGLRAVAALAPEAVLIHDAARPFVTQTCIGATLDALRDHHGAIAAQPVTDTLKRAGPGGRIEATVERTSLWRAQTPQTFRYGPILKAHEAALAAGRSDFTDDAAIAEWYGLDVAVVESGSNNMKVTTPEDLHVAGLLMAGGAPVADVRSGTGFDVHALGPGDNVTLCGVRIPHAKGLSGHSDADVGLHALTDALLGTIGAGDIGDHFPPSDPQWRGADSAIFLLHAAMLVAERGGRITNADITLICERPKIGPHRDAMRARVADLLKLDMERVSLKATTSERLGFTGREEGIASLATVTVVFSPARRHAHVL